MRVHVLTGKDEKAKHSKSRTMSEVMRELGIANRKAQYM